MTVYYGVLLNGVCAMLSTGLDCMKVHNGHTCTWTSPTLMPTLPYLREPRHSHSRVSLTPHLCQKHCTFSRNSPDSLGSRLLLLCPCKPAFFLLPDTSMSPLLQIPGSEKAMRDGEGSYHLSYLPVAAIHSITNVAA